MFHSLIPSIIAIITLRLILIHILLISGTVINCLTYRVKLVQISDIHIGSLFRQDVFDLVVKETNEIKPDAIIISGDLTDDGLAFSIRTSS